MIAAGAITVLTASCGGQPATVGSPPRSPSHPASPTSVPSAASASPSGQGPPGSVAVHFTANDGVRLAGRLFGHGNAGVVLAHQIDDDQSDWWDFADTLRTDGYLVLTLDFRGICPGGVDGCSKGVPDPSAAWRDIIGAARFVRSRGATTVELVGASMGGEASIIAASHLGSDLDALVCLSASEGVAGLLDLDVAHATVAAVSAPKLFIAGTFDTGFAAAARDYFAHARPPKQVRVIDSGDHGIGLLRYSQAEVVSRLVLAFLGAHR
jgi:dienelactone hydrolase